MRASKWEKHDRPKLIKQRKWSGEGDETAQKVEFDEPATKVGNFFPSFVRLLFLVLMAPKWTEKKKEWHGQIAIAAVQSTHQENLYQVSIY